MISVAALVVWNENIHLLQTLEKLVLCKAVAAKAVVVPAGIPFDMPGALKRVTATSIWSKQAILDSMKWFVKCEADYLLFVIGPEAPLLNSEGLQRMTTCIRDTGASIVYGDYSEIQQDGSTRMHPLIDYQPGSVRDNFNFGPVILINGTLLKNILNTATDDMPNFVFGGLYDLRLRLSEHAPICHIPEPVYCCMQGRDISPSGTHFAYVDPRNREYQMEMEKIATAHLRRTGAFITTPSEPLLPDERQFQVKASIVIPVKNRARTIRDAVTSALSQKTSFEYNVIVIDNHSDDGTTEILAEIARNNTRLEHRIPQRTDLLIGGCWNEAIYSDACGRYAVQLDSDDIYNGTNILERIIAEFGKKPYALVIGSYTIVNFDLKPLPPGLVDHREWTDTNGQNNALRIAGLGAPRAYHVPTLRQFGFPNTSYGEDYAAVLRLCRSYPVGRIYDTLYWCRRWEGNSDSALPLDTANRYDSYKDRLRTIEITARILAGKVIREKR